MPAGDAAPGLVASLGGSGIDMEPGRCQSGVAR